MFDAFPFDLALSVLSLATALVAAGVVILHLRGREKPPSPLDITHGPDRLKGCFRYLKLLCDKQNYFADTNRFFFSYDKVGESIGFFMGPNSVVEYHYETGEATFARGDQDSFERDFACLAIDRYLVKHRATLEKLVD